MGIGSQEGSLPRVALAATAALVLAAALTACAAISGGRKTEETGPPPENTYLEFHRGVPTRFIEGGKHRGGREIPLGETNITVTSEQPGQPEIIKVTPKALSILYCNCCTTSHVRGNWDWQTNACAWRPGCQSC